MEGDDQEQRGGGFKGVWNLEFRVWCLEFRI
jgi:hypothetical protein